jgi:anti-sigma factor RsiW
MIMAVSDNELHAYVDGELTEEMRVTVEKEVQASNELFDHVLALQSLKQILRLAYRMAPLDH